MQDNKLAFILTFLALFIALLHTIFPSIVIDEISLILLVMAAVPWIIPFFKTIKLPGGVELELRELKKEVEETRKEVEDLKIEYQRLQNEYLHTCEEFRIDAPKSELDKLATKLKKLASGLNSIDFLSNYLEIGKNQSYKYGVACAVQVRPQPHMLKNVNKYLDRVSETTDLDKLRLTLLYRLIMGIEEIVNTDIKRSNKAISNEDIDNAKRILIKISEHERSIKDHEDSGKNSIVSRINRILKKIDTWNNNTN